MKNKFNINEWVFIIFDNKLQNMIVKSVYGSGNNEDDKGKFIYPYFKYSLSPDGVEGNVIHNISEDKIFATKEELIKSL